MRVPPHAQRHLGMTPDVRLEGEGAVAFVTRRTHEAIIPASMLLYSSGFRELELTSEMSMSRMLPSTPEDPDALFKACHDRIYRYILRLIRNPAEAEDLTQETFLRAHRRQDSLRDPQAVLSWLYRIATHVCLDRLRQRKRQAPTESEEAADRIPLKTSGTPSALQVVEQQEMSACVQKYLDVLPDHYRAVILLHDLHSLTAPQIAELLGVRVGTVKIRLHRARRKLQQALEAACAFSNDKRGVLVCEPKS